MNMFWRRWKHSSPLALLGLFVPGYWARRDIQQVSANDN